MAFPTIIPPTKIETSFLFSTISAQFDGGYKQTRERFTRNVQTFKVEFTLMTRADLDLLIAHYISVKGSTPFDWTNIDTSVTYSVRYNASPKYSAVANTPNRFNVSIELEEV